MAKRYHHSKRHLSAHDRAVDRKNASVARRAHEHDARKHGHDGHHHIESMHDSRHSSLQERSSHRRDHFNDELHHDRGNERASYRRFRASGMDEGFYAGMEPRRRQEMEDAGYIHEDHSAIANLPQGVIMKPYPKAGSYLPEGLDDTINGVDHQMDYDDSQRRAHFYPKKV